MPASTSAFGTAGRRALESVEAAGGKPYPIPAGASDHPLGGLGFANWAGEVATQEAEHDVFFDHVVVCTVTGSTHAGMIAGFALEGSARRRVLGIDASKTLDQNRCAGDPHRQRHRRSDRRRASAAAGGDHRRRRLRRPGVRRSRRAAPSKPSISPLAPKACSPTRCTKASRWPG